MLINLHVKNMALIRELDIDFSEGLNILTGETGAGKSIIIGSINVALGLQSFKGFAREDETSALVELVFTVEDEKTRKKIEEFDIPMEDGQVIISRRLLNGRSISKVNGETMPVGRIKELASLLIDIHGQHEHQSLLYKKNHIEILDEFAKEELAPYKEKGQTIYEKYASLKQELEKSELDEATRKKEMDFLAFEIEEIDEAGLKSGEDEELEAQYRKLSNARKIAGNAGEAYEITGGDSGSAADMIAVAVQRILQVSDYDPELQTLADQLGEIDSLLSDFNHEMAHYMDSLTFDEYEFAQMEERLNLINHLKSKYGRTIDDVLAYRDEKDARYQKLADYDTYIEGLRRDFDKQEKLLRSNAAAMSEIRVRTAKVLAEAITKECKDLNFLETNFAVTVEPTASLSANGYDDVCFMISMNPGSPIRPLGDVASGGELSRIMLAIKTVLADKDQTESLIFDEIDVGISGRTAQKVSEKMAVIAKSRQVLCITHLAQIAAMANHHYYIEKQVHDSITETGIRELSSDETIQELARILGGAQITDKTIESAKEMKELAASFLS